MFRFTIRDVLWLTVVVAESTSLLGSYLVSAPRLGAKDRSFW